MIRKNNKATYLNNFHNNVNNNETYNCASADVNILLIILKYLSQNDIKRKIKHVWFSVEF